jgi:two-component system response regulator
MSTPLHILLVDDDKADIFLTRKALQDCDIEMSLSIVNDGIEALEHLDHSDGLPKMILLDLNMPRMDGFETLERLKNDPRLNQIPVVVLTTSNSLEDVMKSYESLANCYVSKSASMSELIHAVTSLQESSPKNPILLATNVLSSELSNGTPQSK